MTALPDKLWLRRGEVLEYLGLDGRAFTKLLRAGLIKPKYFQGLTRAFYERAEVVKLKPEERVTAKNAKNTERGRK